MRLFLILFCTFITLFSATPQPKGTSTHSYPYNIEIKEMHSIEPKRASSLEIYQNDRLLASYENYSIKKVFQGDLNNDGYEEVIFQGFSGGTHCCFALLIVQIRPNMPKPLLFPTNNSEFFSLKDVDRDKKIEILTWDDSYSSLFFSFANAPSIKVVLRFDGKRLLLVPNLIKKLFLPPKKLYHAHVTIDDDGFLQFSTPKASSTISAVLYYLYTGQRKEAVGIFKKYLHFSHPAVRKLFIIELLSAMSRSPFWEQIKSLNSWQYETACFHEGCTPPVEYWSKDKIITWLFKETA